MKRGLILTIGCFLMTNINSQYYIKTTTYGANIYQSTTGSGYGASYNMSVNVIKNQRLFELGFLINSKDQHFMGFEFAYKHFTGFNKANFHFKPISTYFHYNFTFRNPEEIIVNSAAPATKSFDPNMMGGKMRTFEHTVGFGLQVKIFSQVLLDSNVGIGVYFGSKYQGMHPNSLGIHLSNFGIIPSIKLGVGYKF